MTRWELADIVRERGLLVALQEISAEQIDDGDLYRWWAKAAAAVQELKTRLDNCQGKN